MKVNKNACECVRNVHRCTRYRDDNHAKTQRLLRVPGADRNEDYQNDRPTRLFLFIPECVCVCVLSRLDFFSLAFFFSNRIIEQTWPTFFPERDSVPGPQRFLSRRQNNVTITACNRQNLSTNSYDYYTEVAVMVV